MAKPETEPRNIGYSVLSAFREYEREVAVANARRAAILAAIFMIVGGTLDIVVFPECLKLFLVIRICCGLLLVLIYLDLKSSSAVRRGDFVATWIAILPMISICMMIYFTGGGNSLYYAGLNLVLVGLSLLLRWNFWRSVGMTLVCAVCYSVSVALAFEDAEFKTLFSNSYFSYANGICPIFQNRSIFENKECFYKFLVSGKIEESL